MDHKSHILFETEGITQSDRVLYTPGEFARKNLLFVQETGILTSIAAHKSSHRKLDSYLLLEVIEGKGVVTIESKEYPLNTGDAVLIDCNKDYYHMSDANDMWTIAWVHFNGYAAAGYYDTISSYCGNNSVLSEVAVKQLVDEIMPMLYENHLSNELVVAEKLQHILNQLLQQVIRNEKRECGVNWNHVRECVNARCLTDDFEMQNYISEIEKKFRISEEEILAGFANHFGVDLESYIVHRKLTVVKEKLRFTTQTIEKIVTDIGMKSVEDFIELFKKYENMTPTEYRRSWAQWIRS
ncbi:MAG: helix-turn-helix domain-containing protein [Lachnospiraceae bacterium]|nr:helix-turn-helix domain-containing protein [Lachnospiraceae bacterium]